MAMLRGPLGVDNFLGQNERAPAVSVSNAKAVGGGGARRCWSGIIGSCVWTRYVMTVGIGEKRDETESVVELRGFAVRAFVCISLQSMTVSLYI